MTKKIAIIGCGEISKSRLDVLKSRAINEFGNDVEFNVIIMNKVNKLPTARESFKSTLDNLGFSRYRPSEMTNSDYWLCTCTAMEEYKDLHTAPLHEELEKLRAENERLKDEITESNKQQTDLSYCALELTPLSQISDEDLKVIADILSFHDGEGLIIFRKKVAGKFNGDIELYDKYNDNPHYINTLFFYETIRLLFKR